MSILIQPSPMSLFPVFLTPPIPFRPRCESSTSSSSSSSLPPSCTTTSPSRSLGLTSGYPYLAGHTSYLRCDRCAADFCPTSQIISKGFTGRHGRAYLVSASPVVSDPAAPYLIERHAKGASLPNTRTHKAVPRQLVTGAHTVSDVSCAFCGSVIGWKYDSAEEETQRYKVGKYILETKKIFEESCWEQTSDRDKSRAAVDGELVWDDSVEFDSQDEDECEDLFAGVWSPALAVRRRQGKLFEQHTRPRLA